MTYKVLENRKYILLFEGGGGERQHSTKKKKDNCTPLECVSIPKNSWVVMRDTTGKCDIKKNGECFPIVSLLQLILVSQINLRHQCDLHSAPPLALKRLVSSSHVLQQGREGHFSADHTITFKIRLWIFLFLFYI